MVLNKKNTTVKKSGLKTKQTNGGSRKKYKYESRNHFFNL